MDGSDTEFVYCAEVKTYEESLTELVKLFERKMDQGGWGDNEHPNAVIATVHVTDMGEGETYGTDAFGVRVYADLDGPWQADFPGTLAIMAKQFFTEETELITAGTKEADGDDSELIRSIDTSFLGWAVSFEAFRVTSDDRDVERYARLRQIDRHPNRVEQRMVIFMGIESTVIVVTRDRGQSDDEVSVTVMDGKKQIASGNVHQSLRIMNMASILSILRRFGENAAGPIYDLIRRQQSD